MVYLLFPILGLIIGSFLNSVVYRLNLAESFWERSHCPKCRKQISWHDNVPVLSFILLGSKCRSCHEKISWQYPIIEIVTGLMFTFIGVQFFSPMEIFSWFETLFLLFFVSSMLVIFIYDMKHMEIPMFVVWICVCVTISFLVYAGWFQYAQGFDSYFSLKIVSGLIGGLVAAFLFWVLSVGSKEKWMGMGDVYLVFLLGLFLGWPKILIGLMLSFMIGAIAGIILILMSKKTMKSQIPFAPFLIIGALITFVLYEFFPLYLLGIFNI